jgi:hypothetical protein
MPDWQTIAVALIILAACVYAARRGWARLRSFRAAGANTPACTTGCGSCGSGDSEADKTTPHANVLVQIGRTNTRPRHRVN